VDKRRRGNAVKQRPQKLAASGQDPAQVVAARDNGRVVPFPQRYFGCKYCKLQSICVNLQGRDGALCLADIIEHPRPYQRGDYLFRQGDPVRYFYIINSGVAKQFVTTHDGVEQVVNFTLVGESVSLDYLEGGRHNSNVMALDTTNVCAIPVDRLNKERQLKALLADYLLRYTATEIIHRHELQQLIGQGTAENKLAYFLNDMVVRLGHTGRANDCLVLAMSRHDIANYLCLADETVSRLFRKFSEWGMLEVDRKHICIVDFDSLRGLANGHRGRLTESA